jgi:magnesium-transporting ATPase (P-type)
VPVATAVVDCPADPSIAEFGAVASVLGADLQSGLTAAEAASRLARDGSNELRAVKQRSTWRRAPSQLQDPLVGLLLVAAAVALLAWWVEALSIALVAGRLYPLTGWLQSPTIAALAMSLSSASAIGNALRLRGAAIDTA